MKKLILLALLVAVSPVHADTLASLERFFHDVRSYSAGFEQVVLDRDGRAQQRSSGRLWIARPGRFRWDYIKPYEQHIIGDGKKVWVYDVDLQQVTVRPMGRALGDTPALLLAGQGSLKAQFTIKDAGRHDGLAWVQLEPHEKEAGFERIGLGFKGTALHELRLSDSFGQTTRITLSDVRENVPIDAARFRFTPPPGVDVLQQ